MTEGRYPALSAFRSVPHAAVPEWDVLACLALAEGRAEEIEQRSEVPSDSARRLATEFLGRARLLASEHSQARPFDEGAYCDLVRHLADTVLIARGFPPTGAS